MTITVVTHLRDLKVVDFNNAFSLEGLLPTVISMEQVFDAPVLVDDDSVEGGYPLLLVQIWQNEHGSVAVVSVFCAQGRIVDEPDELVSPAELERKELHLYRVAAGHFPEVFSWSRVATLRVIIEKRKQLEEGIWGFVDIQEAEYLGSEIRGFIAGTLPVAELRRFPLSEASIKRLGINTGN